jgi:hypothetical protein
MTDHAMNLRVVLQQMERLLLAIEDLRQNVLPEDPILFAAMVEAPLEDLARIRRDINDHMHALKSVG